MKSDVNMLYLSIAIAVICGILLLFGYKALYERNINKALNHKKVYKLPPIWVVLLVYIVICVIVVDSFVKIESTPRYICDVKQNELIFQSEEQESIDSILSKWLSKQKHAEVSKYDQGNGFEVIIGNSDGENNIVFVSYHINGVEENDKLEMEVKNVQQIFHAKFDDGHIPYKNGGEIYFYFYSKNDSKLCTKTFEIFVKVKGKNYLSAEKEVNMTSGEAVSLYNKK